MNRGLGNEGKSKRRKYKSDLKYNLKSYYTSTREHTKRLGVITVSREDGMDSPHRSILELFHG